MQEGAAMVPQMPRVGSHGAGLPRSDGHMRNMCAKAQDRYLHERCQAALCPLWKSRPRELGQEVPHIPAQV